jgi:hypothetical protein
VRLALTTIPVTQYNTSRDFPGDMCALELVHVGGVREPNAPPTIELPAGSCTLVGRPRGSGGGGGGDVPTRHVVIDPTLKPLVLSREHATIAVGGVGAGAEVVVRCLGQNKVFVRCLSGVCVRAQTLSLNG